MHLLFLFFMTTTLRLDQGKDGRPYFAEKEAKTQAFDSALLSVTETGEAAVTTACLLGGLQTQGIHICYFSPHKVLCSENWSHSWN